MQSVNTRPSKRPLLCSADGAGDTMQNDDIAFSKLVLETRRTELRAVNQVYFACAEARRFYPPQNQDRYARRTSPCMNRIWYKRACPSM
jgi:hypothetical protein